MTLGDFAVSKGKIVDPIFQEVAIMKQLILEQIHPLELLRELLSNAGAQEVRAKKISITYYIHPEYGHTFEVVDDGCGMNFTNSREFPGRLDRFLGLGFSAVAGLEADEFSWKGIGSKLAYHSHRLEIETCNGKNAYRVVVNEPWQTIGDGKIPKPQVTELAVTDGQSTGTKIKVFGNPLIRNEPFTFEEIKDYLMHRSFVGFTKERKNVPEIFLKVQNRGENLSFGFPEIANLPSDSPEGTVILNPPITVTKTIPGKNKSIQVTVKGFYTWDDSTYGLNDVHLNTGLILSVKGIPYFNLNLRDLGSGQLAVANPGVGKCCLIIECDSIQSEMNISRSGLVSSELTKIFKMAASEAIENIESSQRNRDFRLIPKKRKDKSTADILKESKLDLEKSTQKWVYFQASDSKYLRLMREPQNETDTLAILWKMEALQALPFPTFESLAYSPSGADLVVHFQEDNSSNTERFSTFEIEYKFYNYKEHEHFIPQFPTVICWEINPKPKLSVKATAKPFKFVVSLEEATLRIFTLSKIPKIHIATEEEMNRTLNTQNWKSNY
jgi:hypothetical protein